MPAKPKAAAADNLWAFIGTDDLKVKEAAQLLTKKLVSPDNADFGLEVIEGAADNIEHALRLIRNTAEALQTVPFFGGDKVVWLKGATFLADTVVGRSERTLEALEELGTILQHGLPPDIKFILTATDVDKRRGFFNTLKKVAQLEVHDVVDTSRPGWEEQVMEVVDERAREWNMEFEQEALMLFVMLAGEHTRQIDNELEKLDLFVGKGRAITPDDVRQIVAQTRQGIVWELGNALGVRDLPRALNVLRLLLEQGESAIGVLLAAIVPRLRSLSQARELAENYGVKLTSSYPQYVKLLERLPEEILESIPKKKDGSGVNAYPLYMAAQEMGNYTAAELRAALEESLNANRRLVTSGLDPDVILNQLLIRILTRPARLPARKSISNASAAPTAANGRAMSWCGRARWTASPLF